MVASANISDKSIHPKEGIRRLSTSFLPTSSHKFGHNSVVVDCKTKQFAPSCSSHDSASGDILVIDIFQNDESHHDDRS